MSLGWLWSAALLVVLTFLVIYPVAMLLLGALTNTNPVVDGFGVFDLSLDQFHHRPRQSERPSGARQLADRLRRRHGARGDHRADVLLGGGAHRHAVQALHRGGEHDPAVRAAAGRGGRLVDPRLAEDRAAQHHHEMGGHRLALRRLLDGRADRHLRHLLCALRLHVHRLGAAQHGPGAGGGGRSLRRERGAHPVHRDVPADRAGDHLRHAAVLHRDARHLRHPGGARRARRHPGADHLHLQAHQLVAAALFDRRLGRDHPDDRHRLPGLAAAEGA